MDRKAALLDRIEELLSSQLQGGINGSAAYLTGTLSLLIQVYGDKDIRVLDFMESRKALGRMSSDSILQEMAPIAHGALMTAKADIEGGWVRSLERTYSGGVIADFVVMARSVLMEGRVEVAAVLACAALEDTLKRTGEIAGLPVSDQQMPGVINMLVQAGAIAGPQAKLVRSFTAIRNKAMHAEFDKLDAADVKAVIGFTEEFIQKHLSE